MISPIDSSPYFAVFIPVPIHFSTLEGEMVRWQMLLVLVLAIFGSSLAMRKQGVAVKGHLKCGPHPAKDAKVRIVDIDYGKSSSFKSL